MNNLLQLIWGGAGEGALTIWFRRISLIILVLVVAQVIIGVVALFVSSCVQGLTDLVSESIHSVTHSFTAGDRAEVLTRLCLWLVTIIIILKILVNRNDH